MYKLLTILKDVSGYKCYNNELFICMKTSDLFKNDEFVSKEIDGTSFVVKENTLMFLSESDHVTYFYKNKVRKVNCASWLNTLSNNSILIYKYIDELFTISLYNIKEDKINLIREKVDLWNLYREDNLIYFYDKTKVNIKSLSLLTGDYEWELDLSGRTQVIMGKTHECKIIELLGVYKNHLVVYMEGDRLLSIDISTGQILLETFPFKGLLDVNGFQIWDFRNFKLDTITGYIYMLNKCFYYKIDIETHQSTQLKSFFTGNCFSIGRLPNITENSPRDIMIVKTVHTNDYIYFMGGYGLTTHIIGAFNRITYQIDWQEDLDLWQTDKYNNLKDIQYSNDKLYLLDTEGNLHIFEKEKVINLKESSK